MLTLRPITSAAAYPNSRSAPRLNDSTIPWSLMTMIPSTAESMIDWRRMAAASLDIRWLRRGGTLELELLDAIADLIAVQPEERGRPGLVPPAPLEGLHDQRPFELLQIDSGRRQLDTFGEMRPGRHDRELIGRE